MTEARSVEVMKKRSAARLVAVQLLYQDAFMGGASDVERAVAEVERQLQDHKRGVLPEDLLDMEPDMVFLTQLLKDVLGRLEEVDALMQPFLSDAWKAERVDPVVRAILRAGVLEISVYTHIPARAIVNEYTDIAHAFYEEQETGFINAVLDGVARSVRGEEMEEK